MGSEGEWKIIIPIFFHCVENEFLWRINGLNYV